jgi:proline iminopeptidase
VLSGDLDPFATTADARDLVAALPRELVQARTFPRAGHAVLDDARGEALATIREFLCAP